MVESQNILWKTWRDSARACAGDWEDEDVSPDHAENVKARAAQYAAQLERAIRGEPVRRYVLRGDLGSAKSGDFFVSGPQGGSLFEILGHRAGHPVRVTITNGTGRSVTHTLIAPRIVGPLLQIDASKPREMDMIEALRYTLDELTCGDTVRPVEIVFQVYAPIKSL